MATAPHPRAPAVAVIGAGQATPAEQHTAQRVGFLLAEAGVTVVTGGLGGVMAAACAGARQAGGLTVGILPGTRHDDANPNVVVSIPTGLGEARNALVVRAAHAVIAVGGEYGTLSEIALALKAAMPVVGLGTWELHRDGTADSGIIPAADAADAVRLALEQVRGT
jgi:uncharacterized protein (TIGR00725 family)